MRQYVNRLRDGGNNATARVHTAVDRESIAVVDGDNGLGHLATRHAAQVAIEKAKSSGVGWVGVRNGNHAGPLSLYVNMIMEANMIGIGGAVGSANHVSPFGGLDLLLGTNPLAIAIPAGNLSPRYMFGPHCLKYWRVSASAVSVPSRGLSSDSYLSP